MNDATIKLTDLSKRRAQVRASYKAVRLDIDQMQDDLRSASLLASALCADIQSSVVRQVTHDYLNNLPRGLVSHTDNIPVRALRCVLPGVLGQHVDWNVDAAFELCADILDDVNAHSQAGIVRRWMSK